MAPHTVEGCCAAGVVESSAPMVKKLSNAKSGKKPKNTGLIPLAFHVVLAALLYQDPEEAFKIMTLSASPEHEDK